MGQVANNAVFSGLSKPLRTARCHSAGQGQIFLYIGSIVTPIGQEIFFYFQGARFSL